MKLILVGGFLGSGKTTAIQKACTELLSRNNKVGVITNDQGIQLVDGAFIKSHQIPGREVVKGCFCCNYRQLEEGIFSLQQEAAPDIIFAESVGSCADIVATVIKPLIKFHPDLDIVYTVFADAVNLLQMAKGESLSFDDEVNYIYKKQLEEADILILNKSDLVNDLEKELITGMVNDQFKDKSILWQNSLLSDDVNQWLKTLEAFQLPAARKSLEIDYEQYGAGEAKLAWLDDEMEITTNDFNAVSIATLLINKIYQKIRKEHFPIGHLKFLISAGDWQRKISFTSLNEFPLKQTASAIRLESASLMVNARVQTLPQTLEKLIINAMQEVMHEASCFIESKNLVAFQPGFPKPTHQILN